MLRRLLAPDPMAHRPPLHRRYWIYSAVAYLAPVLFQIVWPEAGGVGDELIWLVTLLPAFLLALHFGLRGALVGLLLGTALFAVVEAVLAISFTPDDWRITVPIWVAYGAIAISVGWLSEELHTFYQRALRAERLAAIGEAALALRLELSDALSVIGANADVLLAGEQDPEPRDTLQAIRDANDRAARVLQDLTDLHDAPPSIAFPTGAAALDLRSLAGRGR